MAKYGLFGGNLASPMQTFEGDSIAQDKEFVYVYENVPGRVGRGKQVAAVKLGDGQVVKVIEK